MPFMDAYFVYNNIIMDLFDNNKTKFMTTHECYKVMPFDLKNMGVTYQRMMNEVFKDQIEDVLEIYMDDTIFKPKEQEKHTAHFGGHIWRSYKAR